MEMRLDRVIRCYYWWGWLLVGQQACSLVLRDNRFYMIRTGMIGAVTNDKSLKVEGATTFIDSNPIIDKIAEVIVTPFIKLVFWLVGKRIKGGEARLSKFPLDSLAKAPLSASVALTDITDVAISITPSWRITHPIPQLKIKSTQGTYTVRFPSAAMEEAERWAAALKQKEVV